MAAFFLNGEECLTEKTAGNREFSCPFQRVMGMSDREDNKNICMWLSFPESDGDVGQRR